MHQSVVGTWSDHSDMDALEEQTWQVKPFVSILRQREVCFRANDTQLTFCKTEMFVLECEFS